MYQYQRLSFPSRKLPIKVHVIDFIDGHKQKVYIRKEYTNKITTIAANVLQLCEAWALDVVCLTHAQKLNSNLQLKFITSAQL
jgi:hypothetical protein